MEAQRKDLIDLGWFRGRKLKIRETDTPEQRWFKQGNNAAIDAALTNGRRVAIAEASWEPDDHDGWWYCENCEEETETPTPYCPHCGAEMTNWWQAQHPEEQEEDKWDKADRIYYEKIRDTEGDPRFRGKGEDK